MVSIVIDPGDPRQVLTDEGLLHNVHPPASCGGEACVIHNPSNHSMREWSLHWRDDRGIFERICTHGTGHPDPDQFDYWRRTHQEDQAVHGCCGCCRA